MAYKPYKMKGHALPGINRRASGTSTDQGTDNLSDGRSASSPAQASPAKLPDVWIGGINKGTGPKAMREGIAQEKKNIKVDVGYDEAVKAVESGDLAEVRYTGEDAISRLNMARGDESKSDMVKEYKETGEVSGKKSGRAKAAKVKQKERKTEQKKS